MGAFSLCQDTRSGAAFIVGNTAPRQASVRFRQRSWVEGDLVEGTYSWCCLEMLGPREVRFLCGCGDAAGVVAGGCSRFQSSHPPHIPRGARGSSSEERGERDACFRGTIERDVCERLGWRRSAHELVASIRGSKLD